MDCIDYSMSLENMFIDEEAFNDILDCLSVDSIIERKEENVSVPQTPIMTPASTSNNVEKRKRGRPSTSSAGTSKKKTYKKFEIDEKTYVWFGNTCVEVGTEEYKLKRAQSRLRVKECRERKRQELDEINECIRKISDNNKQLAEKLDKYSMEIDMLKQFLAQLGPTKNNDNLMKI